MKKIFTGLLLLTTLSVLAHTKQFENDPHSGTYFGSLEADSQEVSNINEEVFNFAQEELADEMSYTFTCTQSFEIETIACAVEANSPGGSLIATMLFDKNGKNSKVSFIEYSE